MLKNVTVTLPEKTLRAVRVAAAHDGISMSKWLGRLVEVHIDAGHGANQTAIEAEQHQPLEQVLVLPKASVPLTDDNGKAHSKEWMNDRESLRRFQHYDLRDGPGSNQFDTAMRSVAEPPSPDWPDRSIPTSDQ